MSTSLIVEIKNAGLLLEGPHWEPNSNKLLFVDIRGNTVQRYDVITKETEQVKLDGSVSFAIPCETGGYVVGLGRSIIHLNWKTKVVNPLIDTIEEQYTENRFNDGKCDSSGRLWAGTMHSNNAENNKHGALYSLQMKTPIRKHIENIGISNGLAWSSDNKIFYYIDSLAYSVDAFDFDLSSGDITNRRKVADFTPQVIDTNKINVPDGMCIDQNGKLWVATFGGHQVIRVDPETGQKLQAIDFPAPHITSCCFGGPDYSELYVTSCQKNAEDGKLFPLSGSLFKVTGLEVKGSPPNIYAGP